MGARPHTSKQWLPGEMGDLMGRQPQQHPGWGGGFRTEDACPGSPPPGLHAAPPGRASSWPQQLGSVPIGVCVWGEPPGGPSFSEAGLGQSLSLARSQGVAEQW